VLKPPSPDENARQQAPGPTEDDSAARKGELSVGLRGVAQTALRPAGKAQFGNRYADVVTDSEFINRHSPVEIVEIVGNRVIVREVNDS